MAKEVEWEIGEPVFSSNLYLFPVFGGGKGEDPVLTLEEGLASKAVKVHDTERVPEVEIENEGKEDVFVLDGEEVIGALQNRVFVTSFRLPAERRIPVPVTCVEAGRWSGSRNFSGSLYCAYPTLRGLTTRSVHKSLKSTGRFVADQGRVWEEVDRKLSTLHVVSPTFCMSMPYISKERELSRYSREIGNPKAPSTGVKGEIFTPQAEQVGFLAATQRRILCLDIFSTPSLFARLASKLLLSYSLDALEDLESAGEESLEPDDKKIQKFFSIALQYPSWEKYPAVGKGYEKRFTRAKIAGKALITNSHPLHLSLFHIPK